MSSIAQISLLFTQTFGGSPPTQIISLHGSGSDRQYFRLLDNHGNSFIGVYSEQVYENLNFIRMSELLTRRGILAPRVMASSSDNFCYLQNDLGSDDLLLLLSRHGMTDNMRSLYQSSLGQLAKMQTNLKTELVTANNYDRWMVMHDLMYFVYCFVKVSGVDVAPEKLMKEIDAWSLSLSEFHEVGFMYRDFQARNIMVFEDNCYFIDYQGYMNGPVAYDAASLLWQAKANLASDDKNLLWSMYAHSYLSRNPDATMEGLQSDYTSCVFLRLVQVMGAYGYRGLVQGKPHFRDSIALGLKNIRQFIDEEPNFYIPTYFREVLNTVTEKSFIQSFKTN